MSIDRGILNVDILIAIDYPQKSPWSSLNESALNGNSVSLTPRFGCTNEESSTQEIFLFNGTNALGVVMRYISDTRPELPSLDDAIA